MLYTRKKSPEIAAFIQKAIEHHIGCLLWPYNRRSDGYAVVRRKGSKHTKDRVAVLVCTAVYGPAPSPRHQVAHSCNEPACINPYHLRWATPKENKADNYVHGTINRGVRNGHAKLTPEDIRAIRAPVQGSRAMARKYGVNWSTIQKIRNRQRWDWLE